MGDQKSNLVRLNVGGTLFLTSLSTLSKCGDNMITRMISAPLPTTHIDDAIFLDMDPHVFRHVLNLLRDGATPPEGVREAVERQMGMLCIDYATRGIPADAHPICDPREELLAKAVEGATYSSELRFSYGIVLAIEIGGQVMACCEGMDMNTRALERVLASDDLLPLLKERMAQGQYVRRLEYNRIGGIGFWYVN